MNSVFFTGNVGRDGEVRTVNGNDVLNFTVAVRQGFSRDAKSEWYRVAVWGNRANSLKDHIKKGAKVAVCGELVIGSYDGKPQYEVRAHEVDPFMSRRAEGGSGSDSQPQRNMADTSDFDDDFVPFIVLDPALEARVR